ncbi:hypothetical protein [Nocardia anaemiae]|uniref:hypothetical protein n=1 Tax=Nocardia anaemiae TaxID=263910 RepID=UPI0007A54A09|nr:hypothetical protein [Nocardia anaemiae]
MNIVLRNAPWWALSLYFGVVFAIWMAVLWPIVNHEYSSGEIGGGAVAAVVGGIIFGAVMGPVTARQFRQLNSVIGPLSNSAYRLAKRAAIRGPVPSDPEIRRAALAIASRGSARLKRGKWTYGTLSIIEAILAVSYAYQAITSSAWYWGQATLFAVLSGVMLYPLWLSGQLERRIELLRSSEVSVV